MTAKPRFSMQALNHAGIGDDFFRFSIFFKKVLQFIKRCV
jgi:hypothetical protein